MHACIPAVSLNWNYGMCSARYIPIYIEVSLSAVQLVLRASRIFPSDLCMRGNKFCMGGEGKIHLVTVARFLCQGGM